MPGYGSSSVPTLDFDLDSLTGVNVDMKDLLILMIRELRALNLMFADFLEVPEGPDGYRDDSN